MCQEEVICSTEHHCTIYTGINSSLTTLYCYMIWYLYISTENVEVGTRRKYCWYLVMMLIFIRIYVNKPSLTQTEHLCLLISCSQQVSRVCVPHALRAEAWRVTSPSLLGLVCFFCCHLGLPDETTYIQRLLVLLAWCLLIYSLGVRSSGRDKFLEVEKVLDWANKVRSQEVRQLLGLGVKPNPSSSAYCWQIEVGLKKTGKRKEEKNIVSEINWLSWELRS